MTVEDTIYIEASPDVVWSVTEDVERWPGWTPTVSTALRLDDGPFGLGSRARIKQPGQPEAAWTVTEFVAGERFTWETRRAGLRMSATHEVSAEGSGTSNVLRVAASGVLVWLLGPVLRPLVRRALSSENRGLKGWCEGVPPSTPRSQAAPSSSVDPPPLWDTRFGREGASSSCDTPGPLTSTPQIAAQPGRQRPEPGGGLGAGDWPS